MKSFCLVLFSSFFILNAGAQILPAHQQNIYLQLLNASKPIAGNDTQFLQLTIGIAATTASIGLALNVPYNSPNWASNTLKAQDIAAVAIRSLNQFLGTLNGDLTSKDAKSALYLLDTMNSYLRNNVLVLKDVFMGNDGSPQDLLIQGSNSLFRVQAGSFESMVEQIGSGKAKLVSAEDLQAIINAVKNSPDPDYEPIKLVEGAGAITKTYYTGLVLVTRIQDESRRMMDYMRANPSVMEICTSGAAQDPLGCRNQIDLMRSSGMTPYEIFLDQQLRDWRKTRRQ